MNTSNQTSLPTQKIAHYRIIRKIGQGGMSIVYEGLDEKLKRPVAIKVLHPFLASTTEYRSRFFREAQAVARLSHQNIVQIFDVAPLDSSSEHLYIVTELLDGMTLSDYSKKVSFKEHPELSAMVIWQVAKALDHAHQKGIIHRDLKPENIMICRDGQVKLMDFGIASLGSEDSITQSGTLLGSLAHLAPEVIKGQKADITSDIFSLSTVFFWMLTGELPFNGSTPHALLKTIVDSSAKKVQTLSPYITDDIALIVEKGMKKDPQSRFKSCSDLGKALENALLKMGLSIDKHWQGVLKDPSVNLSIFESALKKSLEQKIQFYRQQNDEGAVLALECRLKASPKPKKSHKPLILALIWAGILLGLSIWVLRDFFKPEPKVLVSSQKTVEPLPVFEVVAEPEAPLFKEVEIKKPEILPKPKVKEKKALEELELIIWPFADVWIDGKLAAKNVKHIKIGLKPGMHQLSFTHTFAAKVEKWINMDGTNPEAMRIELVKSKPAFLVIHSEIDADVAVDKSFKGSTSKSTEKAIVIPMPDKTHAESKEVIVSQDGYKPFIAQVEFIAGETKHLKVKLLAGQ